MSLFCEQEPVVPTVFHLHYTQPVAVDSLFTLARGTGDMLILLVNCQGLPRTISNGSDSLVPCVMRGVLSRGRTTHPIALLSRVFISSIAMIIFRGVFAVRTRISVVLKGLAVCARAIIRQPLSVSFAFRLFGVT